MHAFRKLKIAGIFIALLLVVNGCSSNAVPTTSPTKVEETQQSKTIPEQQTTQPVNQPIVTPSPAPAPAVVVAPAPAPVVTPSPAPTPAAPPVITPAPAPQPTNQAVTVYVTKTGKKYHLDGCGSLSQSKIPISLSEAKSKYGPCSVCNPPQ